MAALVAELELCRADGTALALWWRNDDVTVLNDDLERLLLIPQDLDITIDLAVIPAKAESALARELTASRTCDVMQHGLWHLNHSPQGCPKSEFGAVRDQVCRLEELAYGFEILSDLFGATLLPILAPPWNRIDDALIARLPGIGLQCLSRYSTKVQPPGRSSPLVLDVQIDLYDWDRSKSLDLQQMMLVLAERIRQNRHLSDAGLLTIGVLTHHEMHDATFARDLEELIRFVLAFPEVSWASARSSLDRRLMAGPASI